MFKRLSVIVVGLIAMLALPGVASAKDYADTALNIIPSGQLQPGEPPAAKPNDAQATMYDGLTPLFDNVTTGDLTTYFKSEALNSLGTDGPGTLETVPDHPGIEITRDAYGVPHVDADTYDDGIFAAGWIAAEDRGLLLQQARYNARVAAIDAPGLSAIGLVTQLKNFVPSQQTEDVVAEQTQALKDQGKEGKKVLADIDTYIDGINHWYELHSPSTAPFTRNDIYALNALKDQFLGEGGGDEARRSQFLGGLQDRLGEKKGWSVFNDLRQFKNKGVPTTIDGKFPYGKAAKNLSKDAPGSVVLDHDSYTQTPAVENKALAKQLAPQPVQASNTLMITPQHSDTGNALMVGGPQIGYFYPGLTYEIDMNAPGLKWRGATSAPFPGYLLIGRGEDFATTLTSASGDVIDQYAETLCGGSDTKYKYKGKCREDGHVRRRHAERRPGHLQDHRPRAGHRLRDGQGQEGRDRVEALELRRGRSRPALQPPDLERSGARSEVVLQRGVEDPADVQLLLHRQQARRRVHGGQVADPLEEGRSRPARQGHGPVRVEGLPEQERPSARRRPEGRDDDELEPGRRQGLRLGRRRMGPRRVRRAGRPAQQEPEAPPVGLRQVVAGDGDLGDERRGDPGHPGDRHGAAAGQAAAGLDGPERSRRADAPAHGRLEERRRQPPRPEQRRRRSTTPGRP